MEQTNNNGKRCGTCEHWLKTYQQCDNPMQYLSETDAYMSPPDKTCELWEPIQ